MKKTILLVLFSALCISSFAQNEDETSAKNMVKLNIRSLPLKNFAVQYERAVAKRVTVAANVGFMPKGGLPFRSAIINAVDDPETERQIRNTKIGNFAVMPEVRFYMGRRCAFHGFYLAPFANISSFNTNIQFEYDDNGTTEFIPMSGKVNGFTGGLMLAQFHLGSLSIS